MPGILEEIADRLARLERAVSEVPAREPAGLGPPLESAEVVWADGAFDLAAAEAFSGLSRNELYKLMSDGRLPYCVATRERLVPRRWFVRYLAEKEVETASRNLRAYKE